MISQDAIVFALSPQQQRLVTIQAESGIQPYYACTSVKIKGEVDKARLRNAVTRVIQRHEIVRTRFVHNPGMKWPVQMVENGSPNIKWNDKSDVVNADLSQGATVRASIRTGDENATILDMQLPAMCADAATMQLLAREIASVYASDEITSEPIQYADVAQYLHDVLKSDVGALGRQHWQPHVVSTQADSGVNPKPASFVPQVTRQCLDESWIAAARAALPEVSEEIFLLTCWLLLLTRLFAKEKLVFGYAADGRFCDEFRNCAGPLEAYLPIETNDLSEETVSSALRLTAQSVQDAREWQTTFAWPEATKSNTHCFSYYDASWRVEARGATFSCAALQACTDNYELKLSCVRYQGRLSIELWHNAANISESEAQQYLDRYMTVITSATQTPAAKIRELGVLSEKENSLLRNFSVSPESLPFTSIESAFQEVVKKCPEKIAVQDSHSSLRFRELDERSTLLARKLVRKGVGPESFVALYFSREPHLIVAMIAVLKAGGAFVPMDLDNPDERTAFMLRDSGAAVVLTTQKFQSRLVQGSKMNVPIIAIDLLETEEPYKDDLSGLPIKALPENAAYLMYTSGSSGQPKGVVVTRLGFANYVAWSMKAYNCTSETRSPLHSSTGFDLSVTSIWPPILSGGTVVLLPEDAGAGELARSFKTCNLFKLTPAHLRLLQAEDAGRGLDGSARCLVVGGEALLREDFSWLQRENVPVRIFNEYGPTETVVGCCVQEADYAGSQSIAIGRPIANTRLYVVDRWGLLSAAGSVGELWIGGAGVSRGYWRQAALTAERFVPDPFSGEPGARLYRSGDLVRLQPEGIFECLGRVDHQVKLRGYRIELEEIEAVMRRHEQVRDAAVILHTDVNGHKQLVGYFAGTAAAPQKEELAGFLRGKLPEHMLPRSLVALDVMPLTRRGKIDKKALPEPTPLVAAARSYTPPTNKIEETLADIWANALRLTRVGIHDNFFELGGDSILTIQIVSRAGEAGIRIIPRDMFQNQTIAALAAVAMQCDVTAVSASEEIGAVSVVPIQQWFIDQNLRNPHHFNQSAFLRPVVPLKPTHIESTLRILMEHHDSLRTRFAKQDEKWIQLETSTEQNQIYTLVDLSTLASSEQTAAIKQVCAQVQRSLNLYKGPLLKVAQIRLGASERLLVVVHHMVIDAVSWQILLRDFERAMKSLQAGKPVLLPARTTSFRSWAQAISAYSQNAVLADEARFWRSETAQNIQPLPRDHNTGENMFQSARAITIHLTSEQTQSLLRDVPQQNRAQIEHVLLAALLLVTTRWNGSQSIRVSMEGHGREDIGAGLDVSRTVGWFTSLFPVVLHCSAEPDPLAMVRAVKEQLRAIPNRGLGYGCLRYLAEDSHGMREITERLPEISFNYVGQFAAAEQNEMLVPTTEDESPAQDPDSLRQHLIDVACVIDGERLKVSFVYSENVHRSETIDRLARQFTTEVQNLLEKLKNFGALVSASDFPLSGLDRKQLDSVLTQMSRTGSAGK